MPKFRIRRGDRVRVIRGNFRDQEGTVLRVDRDKNRVVIQGINFRKRHRKPSQLNPEGAIVSFEAPVHASNVMLIDPSTGEPTRVRMQRDEEGRAERVGVASGRVIPKV
ncbi:50S ribosomal protein L24 [soil metagenome]